MVVKIFLPKLGESIEQASINRWCKQIGDSIKRGEVIAELETSKTTMDIESPINGFMLEIFTKEGEIITTGTLIALVGTNKNERLNDQILDDNVEDEIKKESITKRDESKTRTKQISNNDVIKMTPNARRLANSHGLDFDQLFEAFPNKRITSDDIQNYIKNEKM